MSQQTLWVYLNEIPTKILVYQNVQQRMNMKVVDKKFQFNMDRLILMISGNPGEIDYYQIFLTKIHQELGLPVIGVSNSGHNQIPNEMKKPSIHDLELFGLDSQIIHKATFIQNHISKNTRIIFLAHSIGCYIVLELLERYPTIKQMIDHSVLLFPAIDRMVQTKSGRSMNILINRFYYLILALSYAIDNCFSQSIKESLIEWIELFNSKKLIRNNHLIRSATNLIQPYCLKATLRMVLDEFQIVQEPKLNLIKENADKISMLYGENDHWCPMEFAQRIKNQTKDFKGLDLRICLGMIDHAFVIQDDYVFAVSQLTQDIIKKKWSI